MADIPTLANAGELGPSATPATPPAPEPGPKPPAPEAHLSFEQRRAAQDQAAADKANALAPDQQQPAQPGADRVKVGKFETSESELAAMMERQAVDDLRKATVPPSAEAYEAKLPADLKLPGGVDFKFDTNDPSMIAARTLAFAKGWSQQDFSEALGIFASHEANKESQLAERARAEVAKAGVNATQRMTAVNRWLTATFGEADSAPLKATMVTDAHLRAWETVMTKLTTQGSASFTQSHRVPPDDKAIPGYDKMSFEQRRFAQDQLRARGGGR